MIRQWRTRWFWLTRQEEKLPALTLVRWTLWLCIGGKKPGAHLPRWRRIFRPVVRWRLL